jgi:hypothetical protein
MQIQRLVIAGCLAGLIVLAFGRSAQVTAEEAPAPGTPRVRPGVYTTWQYQTDKKRYWCRYEYSDRFGRPSYQFVLYYPDEGRSNVYYFQSSEGRIWACCTRPGAPGYSPSAIKWYRQDRSNRWVRRVDGDNPMTPDGSRYIGLQGDSRLPVPPAPETFAKLPAADRAVAERMHALLAEVAIEDDHIVGLDFGGSELKDEALPEVGKIASLQRLYLNSTQITDAGLKHLKGLSKLTHLDVSQTQVTDEGLKHLKELDNLRTLIVRGSGGISADGVRTARQSNPKLLITGP